MGVCKKALKPMFKYDKWRIVSGDTVRILCGKDKNQEGVVRKVYRDKKVPKVLVQGINLVKRHLKQDKATNSGGIVTTEAPIHYSNVALIDPITKKPVRTVWRFLEDGTKVRVGKGKYASGTIIPKPQFKLKERRTPPGQGLKDTPQSDAGEVTYRKGDLPATLWEGKSRKSSAYKQSLVDATLDSTAIPSAQSVPTTGKRAYSTLIANSSASTLSLPSLSFHTVFFGSRRPRLWSSHGFAASSCIPL